jgi:hypothetical protein
MGFQPMSSFVEKMPPTPRIIYCHCAYAQVVPKATKEQVLADLLDSGVAFDAVADLCEMSAKRDPMLQQLAAEGAVKIAACYPRAVKWLFSAADAPIGESTQVLNMRTETPEQISFAILGEGFKRKGVPQ